MSSAPKLKVRQRINTLLWPIIIGLLLFLQIFFPYKGWLILLIGLGGVFIISFFWSRAMRKQLLLNREIRFGWAQVGDMLEERFNLTNMSFFPAIWVEIVDHSTIPGESLSRATGVGSQSHNEWLAHQTCNRRGLYTLGPTTIRTGDPFGVFTVEIQDDSQSNILVTPPILPLPSIQIASGGRSGDGRPTRSSIDKSVSTSGVRDYLPGDSLRWIHWPTSARRNSFYVRTFDNTPASDWWILLDLDKDVQLGTGSQSTEEAGVIVAASIASRGLKSGVAVGLIASSQDFTWIPPRLGEGQRWEILQTLARVNLGDRPLVDLLNSSDKTFRYQTSLIIVTSSVDESWLSALTLLLWRGIVPTVLLLDPQSFGEGPSAAPFSAVLQDLDVAHYLITPDLLEPSSKDAKKDLNAWDWRVMPTGKAIPVQKPKDLTWKALS